MSSKSSALPKDAVLPTPASWRKQTPEARLEHLSLFLQSTKKQSRSQECDLTLREALRSARACISHLRESRAATLQGELVTSYHPGEEIVLNGGIDALAQAVVPLVAGCVVRIVGFEGEIPAELRGILGSCDDKLDKGMAENSVNGDLFQMGEGVALLIDETADISPIRGFLYPVKGLVSRFALYIHAGVFESIEELLQSRAVGEKKGISVTKVAELDDAIDVVNKLCYNIACVYGDESSMESIVEGLTVPRVAVNTSPVRMLLTTDGASVLQYVRQQRVLRPFKSQLALLKHYLVGRFDNSTQIAREKASGAQRTAYAVHINDVIDKKIEGEHQEGVFHILEETYKYAPGERNPQIAPLILRFEEIDGAVALSSMKAPEGVENTALRNDNPCLWFRKGELMVSPSFPERRVYQFNEARKEFMIDVEVQISGTVRFKLSETLARDRLVVSEKLWIGDKLKQGFYEEPFIYDRVYS